MSAEQVEGVLRTVERDPGLGAEGSERLPGAETANLPSVLLPVGGRAVDDPGLGPGSLGRPAPSPEVFRRHPLSHFHEHAHHPLPLQF